MADYRRVDERKFGRKRLTHFVFTEKNIYLRERSFPSTYSTDSWREECDSTHSILGID